MPLSRRTRSQFIDIIDFVDTSKNKLLVSKYTRDQDEIKQGAKLIVRNGQAAVFVPQGQIADVFSPGEYKLDTGNLPILSTLGAWPYRFNSPIKSDVYFINTTDFIGNKWGTKSPIIKRDPEMGLVRIGAFGSFAFKVTDPKTFMEEMFGARKMDMTYDIVEFLKSFVTESAAECLGEMDASVIDMATKYKDLAESLTPYVNEKARKYGISITSVAVESINLPEEVEKLIDEQSGIGLASRDMDTFVRYQSARAIRDAAKQQGGLAGLGAGAAVGQTVARSMGSVTGNDGKDDKSASDKLKEYKELLDQGILTQDEFDDLKAKLIKDL